LGLWEVEVILPQVPYRRTSKSLPASCKRFEGDLCGLLKVFDEGESVREAELLSGWMRGCILCIALSNSSSISLWQLHEDVHKVFDC
jgi:hypothetical protein